MFFEREGGYNLWGEFKLKNLNRGNAPAHLQFVTVTLHPQTGMYYIL